MMNSLAGRTLGQYQILEEIGRGGMAVVYRAYQPRLNRHVAVKVLPPQLAIDPDFVQRFLNEAHAAARLDHPNIVTVHDVGEQDGFYYIVMQELQGESLSTLIRRESRLPLPRTSHILAQVASALDYAHSQGFVHRDVKPGNIIVGPDDRATLTDFGIAKAMAGARLTQSGVIIGTPQYMAPEQIKGEPVGPATDIYSLGIVLYEMLAGRVPFDADTAPAVMYKQVHEPPAPVRVYIPNLPPAVDQVLSRALSKNPTQRFRTAMEMAVALEPTFAVRAAPTAASEPATITRKPPAPTSIGKNSTNRKWLGLGAAAAAVLIVVLAIAMVSRPGPAAQTPIAGVEVATPSATPTAARISDSPPTAAATALPKQDTAALAASQPAIVARQTVNVYTGPDKKAFLPAGQVMAGEQKEIYGQSKDGQWLQICCVGGDLAWVQVVLVDVLGSLNSVAFITVATSTPTPVQTPALFPTDTPTLLPELIIDANTVNVRSGPGVNYPQIAHARENARYRIIGKNPDSTWWQVLFNGQAAWISADSDLVSMSGSAAEIPIIEAEAVPDPGMIVFASDKDGFAHLFLMQGNGQGLRAVTRGQQYFWDPVLTEAGRLMAFVSKVGDNTEVFVGMGDDARPVSNHPAADDHPAWFPSGRELAFASDRSGNWEIYRMNADGTNVRQITKDGGDNRFVAVSPDDNWIAYVHQGGDYPRIELRVVAADGSQSRTLYAYSSRKQRDDPGRYVSRPDWTPDGMTLGFGADDDDDGLISIMLIDQAAGEAQRLIVDGNSPAWSPDGERLIYKPAGEQQILFVADANGKRLYQLTEASYNAWSPDWAR